MRAHTINKSKQISDIVLNNVPFVFFTEAVQERQNQGKKKKEEENKGKKKAAKKAKK